MPFKVKRGKSEIICDTPQEALELTDYIEQQLPRKFTPSATDTESKSHTSNGNLKGDSPLRNFISRLKDRQKTVIRILVDNPEGVSDAQLREAVGAKNNEALAGVTSVMSKIAKSEGLRYDEIVEKTVLSSEVGNHAYNYKIVNAVRDEVKANLDSKLF